MYSSIISKFEIAQNLAERIETGKLTDEDAEKSLLLFDEITEWVRDEGIFSPGETLEDVKTEYLVFILIPYYVYLVQTNMNSKGRDREAVLLNAKLIGDAFINKVLELQVLDEQDAAVFKRYVSKKGDKKTQKPDASEQRTTAIRLFKEEREMLEKLKAVRAKLVEKRSGEEFDDIDEDIRRELFVTLLSLYSKKYISSLSSFEQELEILKYMKSDKFKEDELEWEKKAPKDGKPLPNKGIQTIFIPKLDQKIETQKQVTRPFGTQPIPLDDYAMLQKELKEEGVIRGTGEKEIQERKEKEEMEEDDVGLYDTVKIYEAREWDTYKDENPRGSGNRPGRV